MMKKLLFILTAMFISIWAIGQVPNVWINEIHYDNSGTDEGEFLEVIVENPGSWDLGALWFHMYNGNNGATYGDGTVENMTEGATIGNYTIYYTLLPGIQNGSPDGFSLSYYNGSSYDMIPGQFLSYEGTFTAIDGPAVGLTSVDIGVAEGSGTPIGESLQLAGTGETYAEFTWQEPAAETPGSLNNGQTLGTYVPDPEPTNYPTDFAATVSVTNIDVTWTDDVDGEQLPAGYLLLGRYDSNSWTIPEDGTPVEDDLDWSDEHIAVNVSYGDEAYLFQFLNTHTEYEFAIFPYTNAGEDIDYKTDGAFPETSATTDDVVFQLQEFFDDEASRDMSFYSVIGDDQTWNEIDWDGNPAGAIRMNGYSGGTVDNEDWAITPQITATSYSNLYLRFDQNINYQAPDGLSILVSTDYTGGDPSNGTWEDITDRFTFPANYAEWTTSGIADVSEYISATTYFAFKYISNATYPAPDWKVDNIQAYSYVPTIAVTYPNGGETLYQGQQVDITWNHEYWVEESVALYLADGTNRDLTLITESTPVDDGTYTWTVWSSIEPGDEFMIMVTGPEGPEDFSDDFFSIVAGDELIADFEADTTMIYVGDSVMFTDLTIGTPISWTWTFEGGTPATFEGEEPPYIHYAAAGVFDVTLEVFDGVSTDEVTMADYITVMEIPELPAPVNLEGEVSMNYLDVELNWLAPGSNTGDTFEDDFESYDDFVLEFAPWTNVDVDGSATYGMTGITWPNVYTEQSFIIFNPSMTEPAVEDIIPHSGDKLAACFAATAPPNNDWIITPMLNIGSGYSLTFWAKSYTDQYGLERFNVGVSTTGMDPSDFTIISESPYVEAPADDWAEFTYDLSAYAGQDVYIGIQCVSNDAFILLVDDVTIGAAKSSIVYNPSQPVVGKATKEISYTAKASVLPAATPANSYNLREAELLGYNVYRDDAMINAELVTETTYIDVEPDLGSHDYYVTAVYDIFGESDPSNVVTIVITDVNEISATSVNVYPNPSNGTFTISLPEGTETVLNVMDLTGKSVYQNNVSGTTTINLNDMYKGIYLLNIYDATTSTNIVKKLVIN